MDKGNHYIKFALLGGRLERFWVYNDDCNYNLRFFRLKEL
jgi:hypothetical protein